MSFVIFAVELLEDPVFGPINSSEVSTLLSAIHEFLQILGPDLSPRVTLYQQHGAHSKSAQRSHPASPCTMQFLRVSFRSMLVRLKIIWGAL